MLERRNAQLQQLHKTEKDNRRRIRNKLNLYKVKKRERATTVRNKNAFLVLHNAFLHSRSSHLGKDIIDSIINITSVILPTLCWSLSTLSSFIEALENKNEDVQISVFRLLDFVIAELNYVPTSALTSLGLLLENLNLLKVDSVVGDVGDTYHSLNSPSLPLSSPQGQTEESIFLIIEFLRAAIDGSDINGRAFLEARGSCLKVMDMLNFKRYRRMALRLMTQLVLLDEGYVHIGILLDILNTAKSTDVDLHIDILQTILAVFQLELSTKALFRDGYGFNYLISVLTSLYGSLGPSRGKPWGNVKNADILKLIQLVFTVLTVAMQDHTANKLFLETNKM